MSRPHENCILNGWRIARREMRGGLRGFRVFLLCLLPGVFAVGGIGTFSASIQAGLLQDARALLGGDLEVRLMHRRATAEEQAFFEKLGTVSHVTQVRGMPYSLESDVRVLSEVKAVDDDYPLYGSVRLDIDEPLFAALRRDAEGIWGAVAAPGLMERLQISVGDSIELGDIKVQVRAALLEEPDRSLAGFTLGPRLLLHIDALEQSGLMGEASLATHLTRIALSHDQNEKEAVAVIEDAYPDAGWRVRTWQQAEPRILAFMERMTFNLTLVALCALLAGGVGVHGAVGGYLQGKIGHIATLKCMGATGSIVLSGYLIQISAMALLAILIGSTLAAAIPWVADVFVGHLLPIRTGIYPAPLATAAIFGFLTALLFSLHALGVARNVPAATLFRGYTHYRGRDVGYGILAAMLAILLLLIGLALYISTEKELALWFVAGAVAVFVLFRFMTAAVLYAARKLPRPSWGVLRMALASIQRPGAPAGGIVFALGLGLTTLVIITQVQTNLNRLVMETLPQDAPGFFVMDIQGDQIEEFVDRVNVYDGVHRVDYSPVLRGRITEIKGVPVREATIDPSVGWAVRGDRFLTFRSDLPAGNEVVKGRWWNGADDGDTALVSITADLGEGLGLAPGDTLGVNVLGRQMTATVANWREVDWGSLQMNFAMVFHPDALAGAPASWLASIHGDRIQEGILFRNLTLQYPNVTVIGTRDVLAQVARTIHRIGLAFRAVGGVALVAGFLVLAGAVAADQRRRIREAVIAKVCGATRGDLLHALVTEFALLAFAGFLLSVLVGSLAAYGVIRGLMQMEYNPDLGAVALVLLPGIAGIILVGVAGTWRVLGQRPARHLREE